MELNSSEYEYKWVDCYLVYIILLALLNVPIRIGIKHLGTECKKFAYL